jgi:hypothetical protein
MPSTAVALSLFYYPREFLLAAELHEARSADKLRPRLKCASVGQGHIAKTLMDLHFCWFFGSFFFSLVLCYVF